MIKEDVECPFVSFQEKDLIIIINIMENYFRQKAFSIGVANFRFWLQADMALLEIDVRSTPNSGRGSGGSNVRPRGGDRGGAPEPP